MVLLVRIIFNLRFRSNRYFFVSRRLVQNKKKKHFIIEIDFIANYDLSLYRARCMLYSQRDYEL